MSNQKALARKSTLTNTETQDNQFKGLGFAVQKKSDIETHKSDLNTQLKQAKSFGHSITKLAGQEGCGASPQTRGLSIQAKSINISPNLNTVIQKGSSGTVASQHNSQEDSQTSEIAQIEPNYDLIHMLKQNNWNWFNLKEKFAYKKENETNDEYNRNLNIMTKLVEQRGKLVKRISEDTIEKIKQDHKNQKDENLDIEALQPGSQTPTSDIDITFQISGHPEYEYELVKKFNEIFMEEYKVTPGVMLDTNAYTSGFMPTDDLDKKFLYKDKFERQSADERLLINEAKVQKHRIQLALSFLPIRQHFGNGNDPQKTWDDFKEKTSDELERYLEDAASKNKTNAVDIRLHLVSPALSDVDAIFKETDELYSDTQKEIKTKKEGQDLDSQVKSDIENDSKSKDLHLDTQAKDALYVDSLQKVSDILKKLKANAKSLNEPNSEKREQVLKERAKLIIEFEKEQGKALIYANEAYFSGGAAYHVVKGMQGGTDVNLGRQQKMQSLLMNIGYKLQHFKHKNDNNGRGRALIDTSKYGQRVSDLALAQNAKSEEAENNLLSNISEESKQILNNEITLVTSYKKGEMHKTPTAKEDAAVKDFPDMTMNKVETAFLEIARKTLGPYYWDKFKTKGRLWEI